MNYLEFKQNTVQPVVIVHLLDQYGSGVEGMGISDIQMLLHKSQDLFLFEYLVTADFDWFEIGLGGGIASGMYILREKTTARAPLTDTLGTCALHISAATGEKDGKFILNYQVVPQSANGGGLGFDDELPAGAGEWNTVGEVLIAMRAHAKGTRIGINDSEVGLAADRLTQVINRQAEPPGGPYNTFREAGNFISRAVAAEVASDGGMIHGDLIVMDDSANVASDGGDWVLV